MHSFFFICTYNLILVSEENNVTYGKMMFKIVTHNKIALSFDKFEIFFKQC